MTRYDAPDGRMHDGETLARRFGGSSAFWLSIALGVGVVVYLAYLATHTHPAYEGGLFLQMAEEIRASDYALPVRIPYYTEGGIPFAYPPLMFYVTGLVVDLTGVDPVALDRYLPGLVTVVYLVPYYFVARELLPSRQHAGLATVLFAATPAVLRWHISAGGLTRAVAVLFTLTGIYTGIRLFRDDDRRWVVPSTVLFGLTVLTHPVYPVFFGLSYLLLYARFDRSPRGLVAGAVVAGGGLLLALPWLYQVVTRHGITVFFAASGTHHGLLGGIHRILSQFVYPLAEPNVVTTFYVLTVGGAVALLAERRWLIPTWVFVGGYVIGKHRFVFVAGAMAGAVLVLDWIRPAVTRRCSDRHTRQLAAAVVVVVVVATAGIGAAFAAGSLDTAHEHSSTQPQTVDADDREAMEWVRSNTDADATFVVLGDAAEWFPYYTERTLLLSPWGSEWTATSSYYDDMRRYESLSACRWSGCLSRRFGGTNPSPEYVYVPKGKYTIRGQEFTQGPRMRSSMRLSGHYTLVYENEGVMVFRMHPAIDADGEGGTDGRGPRPPV